MLDVSRKPLLSGGLRGADGVPREQLGGAGARGGRGVRLGVCTDDPALGGASPALGDACPVKQRDASLALGDGAPAANMQCRVYRTRRGHVHRLRRWRVQGDTWFRSVSGVSREYNLNCW